MTSRFPLRIATVLMLVTGCATRGVAPRASASAVSPTCDLAAAGPWIQRWLSGWELTSRQILRLPDVPAPNFVFYDSACVYTTSRVSASAASDARGTSAPGVAGEWFAVRHDGSLTLPNATKVPVALMSFVDSDKQTGPFMVMAAPEFWKQAGHGQVPSLTSAVFLHEVSHTRQFPGMAAIIGPIDSAWNFPEPLDDDVVQKRFESNPAYVEAYIAERDLLYRAAAAVSVDEVRASAAQALVMMRSRHARWFTGENEVFAVLDSTWLSMEGAGQWAGYAWLAHPDGGGLAADAAVRRMQGRRHRWSQDEGLALFLVVDRLLPEWPSLVFNTPSMGAVELLERAVEPRNVAGDNDDGDATPHPPSAPSPRKRGEGYPISRIAKFSSLLPSARGEEGYPISRIARFSSLLASARRRRRLPHFTDREFQ